MEKQSKRDCNMVFIKVVCNVHAHSIQYQLRARAERRRQAVA